MSKKRSKKIALPNPKSGNNPNWVSKQTQPKVTRRVAGVRTKVGFGVRTR